MGLFVQHAVLYPFLLNRIPSIFCSPGHISTVYILALEDKNYHWNHQVDSCLPFYVFPGDSVHSFILISFHNSLFFRMTLKQAVQWRWASFLFPPGSFHALCHPIPFLLNRLPGIFSLLLVCLQMPRVCHRKLPSSPSSVTHR